MTNPYGSKPAWAGKAQSNPFKLSEQDMIGLRITKTAIIKSAIEGGLFVLDNRKFNLEEDFVEKWIKYIYREGEKRLQINQRSRTFLKI